MALALPDGELTFLFTDIEGSTGILERLGFDATIVFDAHDRILRRVFDRHGGIGLRTQGDSFFVVFEPATAALEAAIAAQRALQAYPWPEGGEARVRIGMHTGRAAIGESGYVGLDVHTAARVCAAADGGQILLSGATEASLGRLPGFTGLRELGAVELKGIPEPVVLFSVEHPVVLQPADALAG